jgi:hypothetical protein
MSATAIKTISSETISSLNGLPAFPWRDPSSVPPEKVAELIASLEGACAQNPAHATLRTFLGMAHAMNYDVPRSMDALEEACRMQPENFFARLKYSELLYRLRLAERAEEETTRALALANTGWELSLARKQLVEIRGLKGKGAARPLWTKSIKVSAIGFGLVLMVISLVYMVWK